MTSSELDTLYSKYLQSKALFNDEISMVGRYLWNKGDQRLKEFFRTKEDFSAFDSSGRFLSNGTCERFCV